MDMFGISHRDEQPKTQRTYHMDATIVHDGAVRNGSAFVGFAVSPTGDYEAGVGTDGDPVLGQLLLVEEPDHGSTKGTVRIAGVCMLPGDGSVTVGTKVVAAGAGLVRSATTGDELAARGLVTAVLADDVVVVEL